jgi:hypothetical protein
LPGAWTSILEVIGVTQQQEKITLFSIIGFILYVVDVCLCVFAIRVKEVVFIKYSHA